MALHAFGQSLKVSRIIKERAAIADSVQAILFALPQELRSIATNPDQSILFDFKDASYREAGQEYPMDSLKFSTIIKRTASADSYSERGTMEYTFIDHTFSGKIFTRLTRLEQVGYAKIKNRDFDRAIKGFDIAFHKRDTPPATWQSTWPYQELPDLLKITVISRISAKQPPERHETIISIPPRAGKLVHAMKGAED
jgi:hypothetical protein